MKAFYFEGFDNRKSYGDFTSPKSAIVVTNAPDKKSAKKFAEAVFDDLDLRIVNAGLTFPTKDKAVLRAIWYMKLTESLNLKFPDQYKDKFTYSVMEWK